MLIALLALFVGGVLLYAGVKNLSVTKLLVGDNQTPGSGGSLLTASASKGGGSGSGGGSQSSGATATATASAAGSAHGTVLPSGLGTEVGR